MTEFAPLPASPPRTPQPALSRLSVGRGWAVTPPLGCTGATPAPPAAPVRLRRRDEPGHRGAEAGRFGGGKGLVRVVVTDQ
ncbi:hypothetical protein [Nonomuraea sp. NPDC048901]|uniref:hypothetical protein n=1 Tax=Nonomuraea sp. NPDC048901 TaxID=3155627 RepID=UPI0033CF4567